MQRHADGTVVVSATDLVGFLACDHLAMLELGRINGLWEKPFRDDPELALMQERGYEHERLYLERLRSEGRSIHEIATGELRTPDQLRAAEAETLAAMQTGRDVIYQATFFDGRWRGHADFLLRVETPSALGTWSYEVADTKLARRVKAAAILQMCVYADRLTTLQGIAPTWLHVVTGDGTIHPHRLAEYAAFYRAAKARFETRIFGDVPAPETYPDPVDHCRVCSWYPLCADRRRADDHLSLVAGMSRAATSRLIAAQIPTVQALAEAPAELAVPDLSAGTYGRLHQQARLQLEGRRTGQLRYELLPPIDPTKGLGALPLPSPLDMFFDIESDPWAQEGGIEYLLGWVEDVDGQDVFQAIWAHDRTQEKAGFERFIDLVMDRLDRDPGMHVYHYAPYEPTALKRLMSRYGTREDEVDRLLRGHVLVDLYQVVRQSLRASVESYSIKQIEKLYMPAREGAVTSAGFSVVEYERWLKSGEQAILDAIASYNRDDCRSTWLLRRWLEDRRGEAEAQFALTLPRPEAGTGDPSEGLAAAQAATQRRVDALTVDVPPDAGLRTELEQGRWLLAQLLDWHRRDDKPAWWNHFRLRALSVDELVDEPEPLADLIHLGVTGEAGRSVIHRYGFATQDHKVTRAARGWEDQDGTRVTIHDIDQAQGWVELKWAKTREAERTRVLLPGRPIDPAPMRDALGRVADLVISAGMDGPGSQRAVCDLILRRPPQLAQFGPDGSLVRPGESLADAARRIAIELPAAATVLPIQGPPGTGKTWTGARMIVELVRAGYRVGITAQAHKAISNLLAETLRAADQAGVPVRAIQRRDTDDPAELIPGVDMAGASAEVAQGLRGGRYDVAAGTAWLFAREDLEGTLDVLFVDEAGQLSLANVVAMGGSARSIVLLGDPNQLPQVTQGDHPEGAAVSALEHLLVGHRTIPIDRGLFLPTTYRMHPAVNDFVAEAFYEDRVGADPINARQAIEPGPIVGGTGLRFRPVHHVGRTSRSVEEAVVVADLLVGLVGRSWTDRHGMTRAMTLDDIVVVAPYNAQVAEIQAAIEGRLGGPARVGTVDRFQGQEAAVAIYSMATSSPDDAPRDVEFLYSGNRLNVAISRARGLAILVANPALLTLHARTPEQLRLANAFCRLAEVAAAQALERIADEAEKPDAAAASPLAPATLSG